MGLFNEIYNIKDKIKKLENNFNNKINEKDDLNDNLDEIEKSLNKIENQNFDYESNIKTKHNAENYLIELNKHSKNLLDLKKQANNLINIKINNIKTNFKSSNKVI